MFSTNLDFLMSLTNTSASALSVACHLDASHVSRLRNGTRALPKRPEFLPDMCGYFARHIREDYQRAALCSLLNLSSWPANEEQAAQLLEKWLSGADSPAVDISPVLASFATPLQPQPAETYSLILPKRKSYYYGIKGKQEAVLQFFDLILKEKTPRTLYLSSDEDISWLYEDPAFAKKWAQNFTQVLLAGNRVKIIHHIGRGMNELMEAISKWIPIYTTGMIEPYYYPKLRDGIFQRTLFLAPDTAAVVSSTISGLTKGVLNELITDLDAVNALRLEFEQYLLLCRPLMHILTSAHREELWNTYQALVQARGDMICMSDRPTLATMPEWVAKAMQERAPKSCIYEQWQAITGFLAHIPPGTHYSEILSPDHNRAGQHFLPCADMLGAPGLSYTDEEWLAHFENSTHFAESHSGYRQYMQRGIPGNLCLFTKEGCGVIMVKSDSPGVAFAFSEPTMLNAFTDYLMRLLS